MFLTLDPTQNYQDFDFGFLNNEITQAKKPFLDVILQTLNESENVPLLQKMGESTVNLDVSDIEHNLEQKQEQQHVNPEGSYSNTMIPHSKSFFNQLN